jgi:hypothetical protein
MVRLASSGTWWQRVWLGLSVRTFPPSFLRSAEFPEVIRDLPGGLAVVPGQVPDLGGEFRDGEPAGGQAGASAAGGAPGGRGSAALFRSMPTILPVLVWAAAAAYRAGRGQEPDVGAVQNGGEPVT